MKEKIKALLLLISVNTCIYAQTPTIKAKNEISNLMEIEMGPDYYIKFSELDALSKPLIIYDIKCSSTLASQGKATYDCNNLNDGKIETAWASDNIQGGYTTKGGAFVQGIGAKIEFTLKQDIDTIFLQNSFATDRGGNYIVNGYYKSPTAYSDNSRIKKFKVYLNNKEIGFLEFNDYRGLQSFDLLKLLPNNIQKLNKGSIITFEISDVYPGTKYKDVLITELRFATSAPILTSSSKASIAIKIDGIEGYYNEKDNPRPYTYLVIENSDKGVILTQYTYATDKKDLIYTIIEYNKETGKATLVDDKGGKATAKITMDMPISITINEGEYSFTSTLADFKRNGK